MSYKRFLDPTKDYSISKMEQMIQSRLNKRGYFPISQYEFVLQKKSVDFYFVNENFVIEIDGEQIHLNREHKDKELRDRIKSITGCTLREYDYCAPPTKTRADEITEEIIDNVLGLRRLQHG